MKFIKLLSCAIVLTLLCTACGTSDTKDTQDYSEQNQKISFIIPEEPEQAPSPGSLSLQAAQEKLANTIHPEQTEKPLEGYDFYYLFQGMDQIEGKDCYLIAFGSGNEAEFAAQRYFAVSIEGTLYESAAEAEPYKKIVS